MPADRNDLESLFAPPVGLHGTHALLCGLSEDDPAMALRFVAEQLEEYRAPIRAALPDEAQDGDGAFAAYASCLPDLWSVTGSYAEGHWYADRGNMRLIGISPNIALPSGMAHAPPFQVALQQLQQHYPAIRPQLYFSDSLADLKQGDIDIALRGGNHALDAPDLVARPLATWHWQIVAAPAYLAARAPIDSPHQLAEQQWLHYLPIHAILLRGEERHVLEIERSMLCSQLAAVSTLTQAGLGLSMQLSGETAALIGQGRLCVVLPEWTLPSVRIYAVTPHRVQSAKTEAALGILQRCFAAD